MEAGGRDLSEFLPRITARCLVDDLGHPRESVDRTIEELASESEVIAAFYERGAALGVVGQEPIRSLLREVVAYSLHVGRHRGATWHHREPGGALAPCGRLSPRRRGRRRVRRRFLTAAVALGGDLEPERLVDSLWGAAILALWQGDVDEGEQLASRLLEISKTAMEQEHVYSVAIHLLALVAYRRGDRDDWRCSRSHWRSSVAGVTSGCSRSR